MLTTEEQKEFYKQMYSARCGLNPKDLAEFKENEMERLAYKMDDPLKVLMVLESERLLWI